MAKLSSFQIPYMVILGKKQLKNIIELLMVIVIIFLSMGCFACYSIVNNTYVYNRMHFDSNINCTFGSPSATNHTLHMIPPLLILYEHTTYTQDGVVASCQLSTKYI